VPSNWGEEMIMECKNSGIRDFDLLHSKQK
jgi:hypothetical protein